MTATMLSSSVATGREMIAVRISLAKSSMGLVALAALSLAVDSALAREYAVPLRSPATARGFVGGESHDTYVIRARKGQSMTVQISWRREHDNEQGENQGNNHAEFWVGESPNFDGDKIVLGKESSEGKRWSCKIPKPGNYYIYVSAYPTARYTLKVTVR